MNSVLSGQELRIKQLKVRSEGIASCFSWGKNNTITTSRISIQKIKNPPADKLRMKYVEAIGERITPCFSWGKNKVNPLLQGFNPNPFI
jgi:hypothetical protein